MPVRLMSLDYSVPKCDTSLVEFPVLIGRAADSQIRLDDHSISNHHCEIDYFNGTMIVRDLDTVHGTFVNGKRVGEAELKPGDQLAVGMLTFLVQLVPDKKLDRQPVADRGERQGSKKERLVLATA